MSVSGYGYHTLWGWAALQEGCYALDYHNEFSEREYTISNKAEEHMELALQRLIGLLSEYWSVD